jgi:niacin transporter
LSNRSYSPRELAYAGLFGAAAMLLPVLFHLVHLGSLFLPMYLPLMVLAFLVRPLPAALTALITPLLSSAATGMPPFYPPMAAFMAIELGLMTALLAWVRGRWPRTNPWLLLAGILALGRAIHLGLVYACASAFALPAAFVAEVSFLAGWPGMLLMLGTVPAIVRIVERQSRPAGTRS